MRTFRIFLFLLLISPIASAKTVRDTLYTANNDQIILTYDIGSNGDNVSINIQNNPRIIPSERLRKECKGNLESLKVVLFDRVGDFGKIKWKGITPMAFTVPSGLSYDKSNEGFYILGESGLMSFNRKSEDTQHISFPLYVAVYEKKQTYRLIGATSKPLKVSISKSNAKGTRALRSGTETERIAITSSEELEGDNEDITKALGCMQMIRQLLMSETELPFSQSLQMELYNLRTLKNQIKDPDVVDRINALLLECNEKERELKENQKNASLAAEAKEQAIMAQQRADQEAKEKEAEEKARIQEEKQQKRSFLMIIGGVILAIIAFIGNAALKHFRDIKNQKSIMQMQESLAKQAEHEASRRSKEIVRNKTHQLANQGKSKLRESVNSSTKTKTNTKRKSI